MSLSINTSDPVLTQTESPQAIKTAQLAQSQTEIEGQMALKLIQSAVVGSLASPLTTTPSSGHIVNIKV